MQLNPVSHLSTDTSLSVEESDELRFHDGPFPSFDPHHTLSIEQSSFGHPNIPSESPLMQSHGVNADGIYPWLPIQALDPMIPSGVNIIGTPFFPQGNLDGGMQPIQSEFMHTPGVVNTPAHVIYHLHPNRFAMEGSPTNEGVLFDALSFQSRMIPAAGVSELYYNRGVGGREAALPTRSISKRNRKRCGTAIPRKARVACPVCGRSMSKDSLRRHHNETHLGLRRRKRKEKGDSN